MGFMELIYPSNIYCIVCGCMIDGSRSYSLCDDCIRRIHWITGIDQRLCKQCGKLLQDTYLGDYCYDCMSANRYFYKGFACMEYGLYERQIMMDIKYAGKGYMAVKLGDAMFDRLWPEVVSGELQADLIIPIPVSKERLKKRGYNQSALLAKQIAKRWNNEGLSVKLDEKALVRDKATQMLRSLSPAERVIALKDAFKIKEEKAGSIKDKYILLIDDIYTTGATADACSKVLVEAGARRVYFAALASGSNRRPSQLEGEGAFHI